LKRFFQLLTIFTVSLNSSFLTPYSSDFYIKSYQKFDLIYPKELESDSEIVAKKISSTLEIYENSFDYSPQNRLKVIFASQNDQISNGYATPYFHNKIVLFNGGSSAIDYFSSPFWIETLINHELAHSFQLNSQNNFFSKAYNRIFGGNEGVLPIHSFPNATLPDSFLEGNSVLNESIFGTGGRLFSGRSKALLHNFIKDLDATKFINNHLDFPFMEEKYIIGGFFQLYLFDKFGIEKVNRFFKFHSENWLLGTPLAIDSSFKEYFGIGFYELFENFKKIYSANSFQKVSEKEVAKSEVLYSISRDNQNIYFATSSQDRKPELFKISKFSKKIEKVDWDYRGGRFININGEFFESRTGRTESFKSQFALWNRDEILKESIGKVVFDSYKNSLLYFDLNRSLVEAHLFKDNIFIDTVSSSPIFDEKGDIYYFKQQGKTRELLKNGKTLLSFQGFYSKIVDVKNSEIYFIANSNNGSTLYIYREGKIFQPFLFDNIIDGKLLDDKSFLVASIEKNGYKFSILEIENLSEVDEIPFENIPKIFQEKHQNMMFSADEVYNSFSNLNYTSLYLEFSETAFSPSIIGVVFEDPIGYNSLLLNYSKSSQNLESFSIGYENSRYLLNYSLFSQIKSNDKFKISTGLKYNIYNFDDFSNWLSFSSIFNGENGKFRGGYFENIFTLSSSKSLTIGNSPFPDQNIYLQPFLKSIDQNSYFGLNFGAGKNFYNSFISFGYSGLFGDEISPEFIEDVDDIGDIYLEGLDLKPRPSKELHKIVANFSSEFRFSKYFQILPISLRREVIFFRYNELFEKRDEWKYIDEKVFGINFEFLYMHKFSTPITIKYINNSFSGESFKVLTEIVF
jgi:hypothetical protein